MKALNDIRVQFGIWFAIVVVLGGFLSVVGENAGTREHGLFWPLVIWILLGIAWLAFKIKRG